MRYLAAGAGSTVGATTTAAPPTEDETELLGVTEPVNLLPSGHFARQQEPCEGGGAEDKLHHTVITTILCVGSWRIIQNPTQTEYACY
jgi:hypothetical protein